MGIWELVTESNPYDMRVQHLFEDTKEKFFPCYRKKSPWYEGATKLFVHHFFFHAEKVWSPMIWGCNNCICYLFIRYFKSKSSMPMIWGCNRCFLSSLFSSLRVTESKPDDTRLMRQEDASQIAFVLPLPFGVIRQCHIIINFKN